MRRYSAPLLAVAGLLAAASLCYGQNVQFGVPIGRSGTAPGNLPLCFDSLGHTVPQALCDMAPSVIQGTRSAASSDRPVVVTMSPNSTMPGGLPASAVVATASGTTGAVVGTMPAVVGRLNIVCGFGVTAVGGTATVGPISLATLVGNKTLTFSLASSVVGSNLTQNFTPCLPANAINTAITVTTTADGTASAVTVNLWGYLQ